MNTTILQQYKIEFIIRADSSSGRKSLSVRQITPTDINYHLVRYFERVIPDFFIEEILPEINKALTGQSFDEDGGGGLSFLRIGNSISNFSSANKASGTVAIPTQDIKDIILTWVEWVTQNNLEQYI